ncbi:MAG: hypothetical protein L0177_11205 [Chloroflexi bacterium]|nr:hypothetical protein [Chloroflexota bacterium]
MGFIEDINRKIDDMLDKRVEEAEERLNQLDEEKRQCVDAAANTKLELMVLRRKQDGLEITERLTKESDLRTSLHEKEQRYNEIEQEEESLLADLQMFQDIKSDIRQNSLQPAG